MPSEFSCNIQIFIYLICTMMSAFEDSFFFSCVLFWLWRLYIFALLYLSDDFLAIS